MQIRKAALHRRMAWKNGGGETIEIAVHPPGAGLADFDWRVSMAVVASDGPFSMFADVDRTLVILSGRGLELAIGDRERRLLSTDSDPLRFPADLETAAWLVEGPVTDHNTMTRRGACEHRVYRLRKIPGETHAGNGHWVLIVATGELTLMVNERPIRLEAFDVVVANGKTLVRRIAGAPLADVIVAEIDQLRP